MIYTVENKQVKRVILDGVDITSTCFFADDENGYVAIYETDQDGRIIADDFDQPIPRGKLGEVKVEL